MSPYVPFFGVQSWSPFVTRKSGHIRQILAEMTQMLMPKSTKVAQIHLSECNSARIRQISTKIRQISAKIRPGNSCTETFWGEAWRPKIREIPGIPAVLAAVPKARSSSVNSKTGLTLKTLTSLNKEVRPFFLSDNSIWSYPSVSALSDYSIWRSWKLFLPCDHSIWSIWGHCPQVRLSLRKNGN